MNVCLAAGRPVAMEVAIFTSGDLLGDYREGGDRFLAGLQELPVGLAVSA